MTNLIDDIDAIFRIMMWAYVSIGLLIICIGALHQVDSHLTPLRVAQKKVARWMSLLLVAAPGIASMLIGSTLFIDQKTRAYAYLFSICGITWVTTISALAASYHFSKYIKHLINGVRNEPKLSIYAKKAAFELILYVTIAIIILFMYIFLVSQVHGQLMQLLNALCVALFLIVFRLAMDSVNYYVSFSKNFLKKP